MSRVRVVLPVVLTALVFVGILAGGHALAGPSTSATTPVGPGEATVRITIEHSRFSPEHVSVRPGTTVRFVIDNRDPIGHEFIIGDAELHRRHEAGTEPVHPPRPGEVSVAAETTAETTFVFDESASEPVVYACHLPGHFRYGMAGSVDIVSA
jgi:uncharacterized cupredoxin-like copper-binding protein